MKLLELRNDCFLEITKFLDFDDLIRMKTVCKFFGLFLDKYKYVFNNRFSELLGIQNEENLDLWIDVWRRIKDEKANSEVITSEEFVPYYTDGGTYAQSLNYFIHNLIKGLTYCTTERNNILVKYCYTEDLSIEGTQPSSYALSDKVYLISPILNSVKSQYNHLPMIHSVSFKVPSRFFTCQVSTLMAFSSIKEEENLEIINSFYNAFEVDHVMQVSKENGLHAILTEREDLSEITFNDRNRAVAPLFWAKIKQPDNAINNNFKIKMNCGVFARYFYVLLIDANRRSDSNIDCGELRPWYEVIKIRS